MPRIALILMLGSLLLGSVVGCNSVDSPSQAVLPTELVGPWHSITERGNAFSYEFAADGRYLYNALMQEGNQQYTLQEGGRTTATGNQIVLVPQNVLLTRTDPDNAAEPTTQSSPQRPTRTLIWSVDGNTLTLAGGDGLPSVYQRG